jgi:archaellum component FlaC
MVMGLLGDIRSGKRSQLGLGYLRRFDERLDRVIDEMLDVKVRLTAVEEGLAGANRRLDRLEIRVESIERRLDLVDQPPLR